MSILGPWLNFLIATIVMGVAFVLPLSLLRWATYPSPSRIGRPVLAALLAWWLNWIFGFVVDGHAVFVLGQRSFSQYLHQGWPAAEGLLYVVLAAVYWRVVRSAPWGLWRMLPAIAMLAALVFPAIDPLEAQSPRAEWPMSSLMLDLIIQFSMYAPAYLALRAVVNRWRHRKLDVSPPQTESEALP